ncbi:MAG TPA: hypothetical protein VFZ09_44435 [Archangium sp.]|uniref:hypothetical protein n=1 Tax=Archangium sp. TaxID=1872627 RepID=UPI002E37993C|nr:hypothetical protein [Archangium sp.]HEX5753331.1 hypothetical protein [Archangium sp.]
MAKQNTIELVSGRNIHLRFLEQSLVYEGLVAGIPQREDNPRFVERILEGARKHFHGHKPYLIPPPERPLEDPRPPFARSTPPMPLPSVACIARFYSHYEARDPAKDYSGLAVLWFQDEFAFPIDPSVMKSLRELDWERYAFDYDY